MRNLIAISALALVLGLGSPASAQHRHYHNHYNGGWAAPLVGGLIVGGIIGSMASQPRYQYDYPPVVAAPPPYYPYRQICERRIVGYDYYGNPVRRVICE